MVRRNAGHPSLKLLGGFELRDPSGASIRLPTRNAKALLAYIAVQPGQPQSREKLMALLWGERSDKQARHSLNQTLVHIRKAVPGTDGRILDSDRESVTCVPGLIEVDALKFRELGAERPEEAMELYNGPFLEGIGIKEAAFEDWLSAQRSELHGLACGALKAQCDQFVEKGRHAEAIDVAKRLVTLDPLREDAHRQLMRLYHEAGDRTSALKQYHACVEILERELDVGPASETTRLLDEIKSKGKGSGAGKGVGDPDRHFRIDTARASGTGHKPSIAVLPFENMSGDPAQDYFSDGVSEDITTEISRYPDFFVIARHSTLVYKHKTVESRQVARDLGVQFILEGSIRRAGDKVRITAQLIDALLGSHIWAERYDRTLDDIFAVQDEIAAKIVSALADTLQKELSHRAIRKAPESHDAYDKCLQAWATFHQFGKENNIEAQRLALAAIEIDPNYARAFAILSVSHLLNFTSYWTDDPEASLDRSYEAARKSVALDNNNYYSYLALGMVENWLRRHDQAVLSCRRALELNPNDADTRAYFANVLVFAGRVGEALSEMDVAIKLNPQHPAYYSQFLGRAYFVRHRYKEAEDAFQRGVTINPGWPWAHLMLAAAFAACDKVQRAEPEVAEALRISPALSLRHVPKAWPFKNLSDLEHLVDMLRKAGLPE